MTNTDSTRTTITKIVPYIFNKREHTTAG